MINLVSSLTQFGSAHHHLLIILNKIESLIQPERKYTLTTANLLFEILL